METGEVYILTREVRHSGSFPNDPHIIAIESVHGTETAAKLARREIIKTFKSPGIVYGIHPRRIDE